MEQAGSEERKESDCQYFMGRPSKFVLCNVYRHSNPPQLFNHCRCSLRRDVRRKLLDLLIQASHLSAELVHVNTLHFSLLTI